MTTPTNQTDKEISNNLATEFSRYIWQGFGRVLGHGALVYGAHKGVDFFKTPANEAAPQGFFARLYATPGYIYNKINPFGKLKKLFLWQAAEATAHEFNQPLIEAWDAQTPNAQKVLTPLIQKTIEQFFTFFRKEGYDIIPKKSPVVIEEHSKSFFENFSQMDIRGASLSQKFSDLWYGAPPVEDIVKTMPPPELPQIPEDLVGKFAHYMNENLAYAKEHSGAAGQIISNTFDQGYNVAKTLHEAPAIFMEGLHAFCKETGCPFGLAVAGVAGTGLLAYIGLRSLWNYSVSVNVENNNENNVVIHNHYIPRDLSRRKGQEEELDDTASDSNTKKKTGLFY